MKRNKFKNTVSIGLVVLILISLCSVSVFAEPIITDNTSVSRTCDLKTVELNKYQKLTYTHSGTINIKDDIANPKEFVLLLDTSGSLSGGDPNNKNPFQYGLFTGDKNENFRMQGGYLDVTGDIHTNAGFELAADTFKMNGTCETVNGHDIDDVGNLIIVPPTPKVTPSPGRIIATPSPFIDNQMVIEMPDIDQKLRDESLMQNDVIEITSTNYDKAQIKNFTNGTMKGQNGVYLNYIKNDTELNNGYGTFSLSGNEFVVNDKTTYYFNGNVKITNGLKFNGKGVIIATGDIIIQGGSFDTTNGSAFIYSVHKGVNCMTGDLKNFKGIFYVPHGTINFQGNSNDITGKVIAQQAIFKPGTTTIKSDFVGFEEIPTKVIPEKTYLDTVLSAALQFAGQFNGKMAKFGVIKYDETANDNDFKLYNMKDATGYSDLTNSINSFSGSVKNNGKSNLGDALRRAYYLLTEQGDAGATKYVIVLTGSKADTWTEGSATNGYMGTGNASPSMVKNDETKALDYVYNWAKEYNLESEKKLNKLDTPINSVFINCLGQSVTSEYWEPVDMQLKDISSIFKSTGPTESIHHFSAATLGVDLQKFLNKISEDADKRLSEIPVKLDFTLKLPADGDIFTVSKDIIFSKGWSFNYDSSSHTVTGTYNDPIMMQGKAEENGSYTYTFKPLSFKIPLKYVAKDMSTVDPDKKKEYLDKTKNVYSETFEFINTDNHIEFKIQYKNSAGGPVIVRVPLTGLKIYGDTIQTTVIHKKDVG